MHSVDKAFLFVEYVMLLTHAASLEKQGRWQRVPIHQLTTNIMMRKKLEKWIDNDGEGKSPL
ncbi:hypothetical protein CDL12_24396 [Handroanthus impetiginosus]|uniref:Uncharacterized protein n=1 Tax=Handroanthus impetiginosus TaxID=429701 RepID=A0A2G9GCR4_9LAMI|nr:hypothetical protein CDL12_24396 [Handroanthus impetiginosus]